MKLEIEKIDVKTRNEICKAVEEAADIAFRVKIPRKILWRFTIMLFKEFKETSLEYINDLLYIAKNDFEAAKVLYNHKLYAQSVYYLQQSVEKLTKAFGLWTGLLEEKELYTKRYKKSLKQKFLSFFKIREREDVIGHVSPKTFVLLLKKRFTKEYIKLLSSQIKNNILQNKFKNIEKEIDELEKLINKKQKLANISKAEINEFLKASYFYRTNFSRIDKRGMRFKLNHFRIIVTNRLQKILPFEVFDEVNKKLENIESKVEYVFAYLNILILLYPLAIITYPHFTYTRYPTNEIGPKDYNENLGIVSSLENIFELLDKILKEFENLIKVS